MIYYQQIGYKGCHRYNFPFESLDSFGINIDDKETLCQWRMVFYLPAGINIGANLIYVRPVPVNIAGPDPSGEARVTDKRFTWLS